MGAVYAAFDEKLERDVALKVLLEEGESASSRKKLLREARLAAKLQHPNIATVYEVDELDQQLIIVMELLEGKALRRELNARKFSLEESIAVARDMARGLARAHAAGVVHRDIKPENVFLTEVGGGAILAKVLDFGLARQETSPQAPPHLQQRMQSQTATQSNGALWGTPGYVSPEQAMGAKDIDARADLFSFGVVFYEMIAGIRPFRGDSAIATMLATTRQEPRPLLEIVPDLPPAIDEIIKRCLRKKKEERFADGGELSAALEAFARAGSQNSLRLPSMGSHPSIPFPPPSQRGSAPSHPGMSNPGLSSGEGDAPTTGSAALLSTRQETLLALQEQQRDRIKLFAALTIGGVLALTSLVLFLSLVAGGRSTKKTVAASASVAVVDAPPPPASEEPASDEPAPTLEPPPAEEVASAAPPAPAPAPVVVATHHAAPAPRPQPAPATSGKKQKPADCAKSPFTIDSKGVRIPKLYCL